MPFRLREDVRKWFSEIDGKPPFDRNSTCSIFVSWPDLLPAGEVIRRRVDGQLRNSCRTSLRTIGQRSA